MSSLFASCTRTRSTVNVLRWAHLQLKLNFHNISQISAYFMRSGGQCLCGSGRGNIYSAEKRSRRDVCWWYVSGTSEPPVGFDIYSAQQIKAQLYNACSLFPQVLRQETFSAALSILLVILYYFFLFLFCKAAPLAALSHHFTNTQHCKQLDNFARKRPNWGFTQWAGHMLSVMSLFN